MPRPCGHHAAPGSLKQCRSSAGIVLSDIQQMILTNLDYFYLRVPSRGVLVQAASNLGALAAHMTARIDQLALDLAGKSSDADSGKAKAYLTALRGVLHNAGPRLTAAVSYTHLTLPTICSV